MGTSAPSSISTCSSSLKVCVSSSTARTVASAEPPGSSRSSRGSTENDESRPSTKSLKAAGMSVGLWRSSWRECSVRTSDLPKLMDAVLDLRGQGAQVQMLKVRRRRHRMRRDEQAGKHEWGLGASGSRGAAGLCTSHKLIILRTANQQLNGSH